MKNRFINTESELENYSIVKIVSIDAESEIISELFYSSLTVISNILEINHIRILFNLSREMYLGFRIETDKLEQDNVINNILAYIHFLLSINNTKTNLNRELRILNFYTVLTLNFSNCNKTRFSKMINKILNVLIVLNDFKFYLLSDKINSILFVFITRNIKTIIKTLKLKRKYVLFSNMVICGKCRYRHVDYGFLSEDLN